MRSEIIVILAILLSVSPARAQKEYHPKHDSIPQKPMCQRYGVWYTPVFRNTTIDGVAMGIYANPFWKRDTLIVNGLSLDACPAPIVITAIGAFYSVIFLPVMLTSHRKDTVADTALVHRQKQRYDSLVQQSLAWRDSLAHTTINGLSISMGIIKNKTKIRGAAVNVTWGRENEMDGLEVSGLFNVHKIFRGFITAPVNVTNSGKGVQIGLINYSNTGKLLQIGLLNTIGKRTTPFINFNLKRHTKENDV
jgi:hypothetical protein